MEVVAIAKTNSTQKAKRMFSVIETQGRPGTSASAAYSGSLE